MSEPSHPAEKRFGWFKPHPDKTEAHVNVFVHDRALSVAEWAEFREIVGVVAEMRPYVIDFLSLERDFQNIDTLETSVCVELEGEPFPFNITGVALTQAYVTAQRALSNFLTAASAFRARARIRLSERYGKDSTEVQVFDSAVTSAYDGSFAYRLLYNLRNYSQHHASPINMIPIEGKRTENGDVLVAVRVELRRDELLAKAKKMQPPVLKELVDQPTAIPLVPLAREYMRLHGHILTAIIDQQEQRLATFADYARVIIEKSNMPEDATPVIWDGPLPQVLDHNLPEYKSKAHGFSFDEFAFLSRMVLRFRGSEY